MGACLVFRECLCRDHVITLKKLRVEKRANDDVKTHSNVSPRDTRLIKGRKSYLNTPNGQGFLTLASNSCELVYTQLKWYWRVVIRRGDSTTAAARQNAQIPFVAVYKRYSFLFSLSKRKQPKKISYTLPRMVSVTMTEARAHPGAANFDWGLIGPVVDKMVEHMGWFNGEVRRHGSAIAPVHDTKSSSQK